MRIPGFNIKTSYGSLISSVKKDEIEIEAKRLAQEHMEEQAAAGIEPMSQSEAGSSKNWIRFYSAAKSIVRKRMNKEEKEELITKLEEWEKGGIPRDVQAQSV